MQPGRYEKFCKSVFGVQIDHDLAGSKSSDKEKLERLTRTKTLYKKIFNEDPDENVWIGYDAQKSTKISDSYKTKD